MTRNAALTDDELVDALRMRRMGMTAAEIAMKLGRGENQIAMATIRVADADAQEIDPRATERDYRAAYPWRQRTT